MFEKQRFVMNFENCQPEENESNAWSPMPIAWVTSEPFAPQLLRRQVGVRLLMWNGSEAKWVSPILAGSQSWTSSLNLAPGS